MWAPSDNKLFPLSAQNSIKCSVDKGSHWKNAFSFGVGNFPFYHSVEMEGQAWQAGKRAEMRGPKRIGPGCRPSVRFYSNSCN